MRLATTVDGSVGCAGTEISSLLKAIKVVKDRGCNVRPVRTCNIFCEDNLSWLVLWNTPEPGVRNDRSYHPGKTLAPIQVARDKLEHALINQTVDVA